MSDLVIGGTTIPMGKVVQLDIPVVSLYTDTQVCIPVHVIRGRKEGPTVFVSAAVHGDEINGIEIIKRLIIRNIKVMAGSLIFVPMVNVYGVLNQSRYMPDRRDLNRSFPGSENGSLAGIVAHKFLNEIVSKCQYGIDLHTGAIHRSNLPQIRADLSDPETKTLAQSFGVPVLLNSTLRDGSLREAAVASGTRILLYEAGEALRFDELSIRAGVKGVLNVLHELGLTRAKGQRRKRSMVTPFIANNSRWVRATSSGLVSNLKKLGDVVEKGETLATIYSPLGNLLSTVIANKTGIIIGQQNIPLTQQGDAMFHIAFFAAGEEEISENIETLHEILMPEDI